MHFDVTSRTKIHVNSTNCITNASTRSTKNYNKLCRLAQRYSSYFKLSLLISFCIRLNIDFFPLSLWMLNSFVSSERHNIKVNFSLFLSNRWNIQIKWISFYLTKSFFSHLLIHCFLIYVALLSFHKYSLNEYMLLLYQFGCEFSMSPRKG